MRRPKQLKYVAISDNDDNRLTKGKKGVIDITMDTTGHGPMGLYDVIRVETNGGVWEMPAHNVLEWQLETE